MLAPLAQMKRASMWISAEPFSIVLPDTLHLTLRAGRIFTPAAIHQQDSRLLDRQRERQRRRGKEKRTVEILPLWNSRVKDSRP